MTESTLGWRTLAESIGSTTARRDDVDAVHVAVEPGRWANLAGAKLPGVTLHGRLDPHYRRQLVLAALTRLWLRANVDLRRFDVVHVGPQLMALPLLDSGGPPIAVHLDSTLRQAKAQRRSLGPDATGQRFGPLIALDRRVLSGAELVVAMSRWAAADVRELCAPGPEVAVLPPSLPRSAGPSSSFGPSRRSLEPTGLVRLAFVGNGWERKGGPRLLRWHQTHLADRAELHVCSAEAPTHVRARNVVWHGRTQRSRILEEILPRADVFVLPTRSDMSPWAVVEAINAGLPVVSSDVGGLGDLVAHGETGMLLDPADDGAFVEALVALTDDVALRESMAAAARLRARTTLDHVALGDRLVREWWKLARPASPAT